MKGTKIFFICTECGAHSPKWLGKCPHCGKEMHRVPEVIDCWFDSGSMPFAQHHYPFENKELFESQFPADFISEAVDKMDGKTFELYMKYHLCICERPDMVGATSHMLDVFRKE